jgi:hypothetical protein
MVRRLLAASLALSAVVAMSACSAGGSTDAAGTPTPEASSTITLASEETSIDQDACTSFFDVLTITANADVALSEGRMAQLEHDGWYPLAVRVLDRIPSDEESAVSDAINNLKSVAPAGDHQGYESFTAIGSAEWNTGLDQLRTACADVDVELGLAMFTGG